MAKEDPERQWISDLSRTLETEFGKRCLWRILDQAAPFSSPTRHHDGLLPEERLLFNIGQQDFGHWLMGQIAKANPKASQLMIAEAYERKLENERKRKEEPDEDSA